MNYDKEFIIDSIKKLGMRYGTQTAFSDVVICCAYSFANVVDFKEDRENEYLRIINKYTNEEKDLFPKILSAIVNEYMKADKPTDVLGDIYEKLELIKKGSSQFFTPLHICELMAKITTNKTDYEKCIEEKGYIDIIDPTCGSGRTLYASYNELLNSGINNNKILLIGDDMDLTCCCMTYVQLSLMGANAIVNHQDSLTMNKYDTFYTISYAMNKELQKNIQKDNDKGVDIEYE